MIRAKNTFAGMARQLLRGPRAAPAMKKRDADTAPRFASRQSGDDQ
jgi:hypothetical protein